MEEQSERMSEAEFNELLNQIVAGIRSAAMQESGKPEYLFIEKVGTDTKYKLNFNPHSLTDSQIKQLAEELAYDATFQMGNSILVKAEFPEGVCTQPIADWKEKYDTYRQNKIMLESSSNQVSRYKILTVASGALVGGGLLGSGVAAGIILGLVGAVFPPVLGVVLAGVALVTVIGMGGIIYATYQASQARGKELEYRNKVNESSKSLNDSKISLTEELKKDLTASKVLKNKSTQADHSSGLFTSPPSAQTHNSPSSSEVPTPKTP